MFEKQTTVPGFASPRIMLIGAGLLLVVIGIAILHTGKQAPATPAVSPSVLAATTTAESPSPNETPSPSPSPTPTPSPSASASPVSIDAARAAYAAKDYAKAISLYVPAIQQAQGAVAIAQLQYELANSYRDNKQNDLALSTYALAYAQNPKMVVAYQGRANLLILLNRRDEAKQALQAGLNANPGNVDLQRDLSTVDLNGPAGE